MIEYSVESFRQLVGHKPGFCDITITNMEYPYSYATVTKKLMPTYRGAKADMMRNVIETVPLRSDAIQLHVTEEFIKREGKWYNFDGYPVFTILAPKGKI